MATTTKKTNGINPVLLTPMGRPKPIKLTPEERKVAQRSIENAKKMPKKRSKSEKIDR